jgi:hypothetical protein
MRLGLSGSGWKGRGQAPLASSPAYGNDLPGVTGPRFPPPQPGPGPAAGGQAGAPNITLGVDPRADHVQPSPHVYAENWAKRGPGFSPDHPHYGTSGFNDKLTAKDRHGYWDTGNQRTGTGFQAGNPANAYNNPLTEPPRPDFRLVNRTVSWQIGSDATANQDDLTRPYTWLGTQGQGWSVVYGGTPGLYQPYGTRGGIPYPIVAPVEQGAPGDGQRLVWSGPPHGLHTQTPWTRRGTAQTLNRFAHTPQTRPVRQDRPANSPQAGQSYSQTVLPQGASPVRPAARPGTTGHGPRPWPGGRGWAGNTGGSGA